MAKKKGPYTDRINNACKILSAKYREDWYNEIDLDRLDINFPDKCVLGQLYGNYRRGVMLLTGAEMMSCKESWEWGKKKGLWPEHVYGMEEGEATDLLNALWRKRIKYLQEKGKETQNA